MSEQRFPAGWDEQRVRELIAELDSRTEEDWIASDEAAWVTGAEMPVDGGLEVAP